MAVRDPRISCCFMLLLAGALGQKVDYPGPVCGVRGSTVTLPCSFRTLESVGDLRIRINRVIWCRNHFICQSLTPSVYDSESNNNSRRFSYLGDKKGDCTLQISDLKREDNGTYRFRVETNDPGATFTDRKGVGVRVEDGAQMEVSSSRGDGDVKRGDAVTLSCSAGTCTTHQLEVTWFRDGSALSESGPALHLSALTAKDSGNYTCGLKGREPSLSAPYSLHVGAEEEEEEEGSDVLLVVRLLLFTLHTVLIVIVTSIIIKRTCTRKTANVGVHPPDNVA